MLPRLLVCAILVALAAPAVRGECTTTIGPCIFIEGLGCAETETPDDIPECEGVSPSVRLCEGCEPAGAYIFNILLKRS